LLITGGSAPENFTGVILGFNPGLLIAVDAAHMGLVSGQIALLEGEELCGAGFSTHMLPFSIMLQYLARQGLTNVLLLGIEPQNMEFGFELTPPARQAVGELVDFLARELAKKLTLP
jgi:hydrogenase 3 maturation protease